MNTRIAIAAVLTLGAVPAFAQVDPATRSYSLVEIGTTDVASNNNSGRIAGGTRAGTAATPRAFFWQSGSLALIPMSGYRESTATFVGPSNEVLGTAIPNGRGSLKGFRVAGGAVKWLPGLGGKMVTPTSVNSGGTIVGYATDASNLPQAFKYTGGNASVTLGTLGGPTSHAMDINTAGTTVGYSRISPSNNVTRAFTHSGSSMTSLGALSANGSSWAYAVNASGAAVGASDSASGRRAVLWSGGQTTTLASVFSIAYDINAGGTVVGTMIPAGQQEMAAFVWHNGTLIDLNSKIPAGSGWILTAARSINDSGEIVAKGIHNGQTKTVLLRPQP